MLVKQPHKGTKTGRQQTYAQSCITSKACFTMPYPRTKLQEKRPLSRELWRNRVDSEGELSMTNVTIVLTLQQQLYRSFQNSVIAVRRFTFAIYSHMLIDSQKHFTQSHTSLLHHWKEGTTFESEDCKDIRRAKHTSQQHAPVSSTGVLPLSKHRVPLRSEPHSGDCRYGQTGPARSGWS